MTTNEPKQRTDDPVEQNAFCIRYHLASEAHGLDSFSPNFATIDNALQAYEEVEKSMIYGGKELRACALIMGGRVHGTASRRIVDGGEVLRSNSTDGGKYELTDWRERVAKFGKRPTVNPSVAGKQSLADTVKQRAAAQSASTDGSTNATANATAPADSPNARTESNSTEAVV